MKVIGLLGGVASGKSTVASIFQNAGWKIIVADDLAHQVLNYPLIIRQLQVRWGIPILKEGHVDRKSIAKIVFTNHEELVYLEKLIFPILKELILQQLKEHQEYNIVLDAPTLLRANLENLCNEIWFIDCPREIRLQRYIERTQSDGLDMDARDTLLFLDKGKIIASRILNNNLTKNKLQEILFDSIGVN